MAKEIVPQTCNDCEDIYKDRSAFYNHIKRHTCERRQNKKRDSIIGNNVIMGNENIINNNIFNNNITVKQDFSDWMSTPFLQECTQKERKQILEVLEILCDKGYKTAQEIQNFIMKEYKTIQHFEQQIKSYPVGALKGIVSNNRPKKYDQKEQIAYKDEYINKCIVALFNILICKDEATVTPEVLASNPLFKNSSGSLKAWSMGDVIECDEGRKQFGHSSSLKGLGMRQWTPMQDEATWRKLVDVIGSRFIEALNSDKQSFNSKLEYEELATYWEQKLEDGDRPAVIDELCSELACTCRQDHTKGWYNLTNMLAKKQKYLDTPDSELVNAID